jgi:hypothetical protein
MGEEAAMNGLAEDARSFSKAGDHRFLHQLLHRYTVEVRLSPAWYLGDSLFANHHPYTAFSRADPNNYRVRNSRLPVFRPCLDANFFSKFYYAKRRFPITSKCRHMYRVLNVDEIKN